MVRLIAGPNRQVPFLHCQMMIDSAPGNWESFEAKSMTSPKWKSVGAVPAA